MTATTADPVQHDTSSRRAIKYALAHLIAEQDAQLARRNDTPEKLPLPVPMGPKRLRAFTIAGDAAIRAYVHGTSAEHSSGLRAICTFFAASNALATRPEEYSAAVADKYAAAVAWEVLDLGRMLIALAVEEDYALTPEVLRDSLVSDVSREGFDLSEAWPRVYPLFSRSRSWEEFLAATRTVFLEANDAADRAMAESESVATPAPYPLAPLYEEILKAATWTWEKFTAANRATPRRRAKAPQGIVDPEALAELRAIREDAGDDEQLDWSTRRTLDALARPWSRIPTPDELATVGPRPNRLPDHLEKLDGLGYLARLRAVAPHLDPLDRGEEAPSRPRLRVIDGGLASA